MQANLIRIGNSRGVRLPKTLIEQCGFGDTVELRVNGEQLILSRTRKPREGWSAALAAVRESIENDELLMDGIPMDEFEDDEWTW
jgi:antitoxin MazE